jgi:hypothetical protein
VHGRGFEFFHDSVVHGRGFESDFMTVNGGVVQWSWVRIFD